MPFLDFTSSTAPVGRPEALPAGEHLVSLTKLAYVSSKDKIIAVFECEAGEYQEWLGFSSEGAKKRTFAFLRHLAKLADMDAPTTFSDAGTFDAWGIELVEAIPDLTIELVADTWEGKTRSVLNGYFDQAIKVAIEFDPTADGF